MGKISSESPILKVSSRFLYISSEFPNITILKYLRIFLKFLRYFPATFPKFIEKLPKIFAFSKREYFRNYFKISLHFSISFWSSSQFFHNFSIIFLKIRQICQNFLKFSENFLSFRRNFSKIFYIFLKFPLTYTNFSNIFTNFFKAFLQFFVKVASEIYLKVSRDFLQNMY